jgi:phosphoglycolate phosphatase-like HAD superfamily hydrolase
MNFQLIIFDCDGVMFDSRRANEAFYNYIRSHFGLPPLSPGEVDYVHMATAEDSVNYIMPPELQAQAQALRLATATALHAVHGHGPDLTGVLKRLKPGYKTPWPPTAAPPSGLAEDSA